MEDAGKPAHLDYITVIQVRGDQSRKRVKSINVMKVEIAKTPGCIPVALEEKPKLAQSARSGNRQRTRQFAFECLTTRTVEIHSYVENIKRWKKPELCTLCFIKPHITVVHRAPSFHLVFPQGNKTHSESVTFACKTQIWQKWEKERFTMSLNL